ncbi:MAG: phosphate signaling complex protein PhoU [Oscillospiraceae bacterium]|nr:phosphate signaling complex protein PhoU [Oscillospiraceae bacterium]
MRSRFDDQLKDLNNALIEMGAMVENAISEACKALIEQDTTLAGQVIDNDDEIDNMEETIETMCSRIILQQQPVAGDLRLVMAVSKIVTDLERIGDHASDISELAIFLAGKPYVRKLEHIPQMAKATTKMVTKAINAYVRKDLELAMEVITYDDIVDELFSLVKDDLVGLIKENKDDSDRAIDLIMVAKYFERIGDHATNVAEWVVFSLTGEHRHSIRGE